MTVISHHNSQRPPEECPQPFSEMCNWYLIYEECLRYFVHHAQFCTSVQALAAFINIRLPFQGASLYKLQHGQLHALQQTKVISHDGFEGGYNNTISIIPYIRRLVATGLDSPAVLQAFFGDWWQEGLAHILGSERNNFLFATKSDTWLSVKSYYDMDEGQEIPFLAPLQQVTEVQLCSAERRWSEWLAMQDWMIGPRAPDPGLFA